MHDHSNPGSMNSSDMKGMGSMPMDNMHGDEHAGHAGPSQHGCGGAMGHMMSVSIFFSFVNSCSALC